MKRPLFFVPCLAMLFAWLSLPAISTTRAQDEGDRDPPQSAEAEEHEDAAAYDEDDEEAPASRRRSTAGQRGAQTRRLIARLTKLHDQMKEKLDLTAEQKAVIHDLFDEHFGELRDDQRRSGLTAASQRCQQDRQGVTNSHLADIRIGRSCTSVSTFTGALSTAWNSAARLISMTAVEWLTLQSPLSPGCFSK